MEGKDARTSFPSSPGNRDVSPGSASWTFAHGPICIRQRAADGGSTAIGLDAEFSVVRQAVSMLNVAIQILETEDLDGAAMWRLAAEAPA